MQSRLRYRYSNLCITVGTVQRSFAGILKLLWSAKLAQFLSRESFSQVIKLSEQGKIFILFGLKKYLALAQQTQKEVCAKSK